jgi:hypothetical protein
MIKTVLTSHFMAYDLHVSRFEGVAGWSLWRAAYARP